MNRTPRARRVDATAAAWLALSAAWAAVILITDQIAWPIALWTLTTLGGLTWLRTRNKAAPPGADQG